MTAVIFDMDGVLVDSERYWGELEATEIFPWAIGSGAAPVAETTGMEVREVYTYLDERYGLDVSRDEFLDRYDVTAEELYSSTVSLLDGFGRLCQTLDEYDCAVALASSSPHDWIRLVLDRFELHAAFDEVVSADDIAGPSKPAPEIYHHTASLLGARSEECVAIEDSTHGVAAANAAGMYSIGFRPSYSDQELDAADHVVETSGELGSHLEEVLSQWPA